MSLKTIYYADIDQEPMPAPFDSLRPKPVNTAKDLLKRVRSATGELLCITHYHDILKALKTFPLNKKWKHELIVLGDPSLSNVEILRSYFTKLIFEQEINLPLIELADVMVSRKRSDLIIGGTLSIEAGLGLFFRGDLSVITVPLSAFETSGDGIVPDFSKFSVTDHGQTLCFGEFEATTDSILYEFDSSFRKRYKKNLIMNGEGLGASIRRLRLQKKLRQSDFKGVDEKEIRRIEAGEVKRPHAKTLERIASTLKVNRVNLGDY